MTFTPDDELLAELKATFAVEASEHVASLNHDLLALERSDSADEKQRLLREIFRNAHTLKGGASVVGLQDVRTLAHQLESIFGRLQNNELAVDAAMFDVLYQALDVIDRLVQEGPDDPPRPDDIATLGARLAAIGAGGGSHAAPPPGPLSAQGEEEPGSKRGADVPDQPETSPSPPQAVGGDTVRIATSKLDELMTQVGELVIAAGGSERTSDEVEQLAAQVDELARGARPASDATPPSSGGGSDLADLVDRVDHLRDWVRTDARRMSQVTGHLQEGIRRARMLPVSAVFDVFPRMVRDLARSQGKQVRLEVRGGETEMDRAVLEQIKDPLTHILRNCVDHGIEEPEARGSSGKPHEGTIVLSAAQKGDTVRIEVADDGAGIDLERVKASAVEKGGMRADDVEEMEKREALSLIFRSGLSTSPLITSISGRGVGLDVVRENVERLHGTIEVETDPGRGTSFSLVMPLTVTTTRCVLVRSGDQTFGVPLQGVVRSVRISPEEIREAEGSEAIVLPEGPLPLRDLAGLLGLERQTLPNGHRPVLVARSADRSVGLMVDDVVGIAEAVVKNLPRPLSRVRHAAGASVLGTGDVVVVLNVADLVRSAVRSADTPGPAARRAIAPSGAVRGKILLADDSITTRTLEKNILISAGYDVTVAIDGADAWRSLQEDLPDLLVSDVQMPGMDGFELTAKVRSDDRSKHLPVVLVTSLESETDRERGIDVGADAYIGKSTFDQEQLLDVVRRLI